RISANGQVWLVNPSGIFIGAGAKIDVAGFLATTHDISNADFMAGRYRFGTGTQPSGSVENEGTITIAEAGLAALVAPHVANRGVIAARLGQVALASGNAFTVDFAGDGLISFAVTAPVTAPVIGRDGKVVPALVENAGQIHADGGRVLLTASAAKGIVERAISMSGVVQARSVTRHADGTIELLGEGAGRVEVSGTLDASAAEAAVKGGRITVAGEAVALASTARIDASGPVGGTVTLGTATPTESVLPTVTPTRRPATRTVAADKGSVVVAAGASGDGGTITVTATQGATLGGTVAATGGAAGTGGTVAVTAGFAALGGMVDASGATGGTIAVTASGTVSLAETVRAIGTMGAGGRIDVAAGGVLWETSTSLVDTSGRAGGSVRITAADGLTTSGTWRAVGTTGAGGSIDASGWGMRLLSATADASGLTAGGTVRIGGEYQGGKGLSRDDLPNAVRLYANDATRVVADARGPAGDGGTVIVWADRDVLMQAAVSAVPGAVSGKGGFVEVSAGDRLTFAGTVAAGAPGRPGTVLFDPKNITIGTPTGFSPVSILIGTGYVRGTSYALDSGDQFGASVALNIDANRMAVGAPSDDGFGNGDPNTGAVHLFTFSDT
ncbi:MAG: filamentous hemagglutinin N-terminal domain-containing protein, partial [Rhodospirillales bacterium]